MKPSKLAPFVLLAVGSVALAIFLWWHWRLGLTRYFDVDEYAHLHWAAQMMMGKKPYVDFLSFFPPGFAWFLTPALFLGWGTAQPFVTARVFMFLVFAAMCAVSALIFWDLRKSLWGAVTAAMLLAFLPMPFDKYLEIRPDNLATLLILVAVYFQIRWMEKGGPSTSSGNKNAIISGAAWGLSYIVLPKMLPNAAVGMLVAGMFLLKGRKLFSKKVWLDLLMTGKPFLAGLGAPVFLFLLWALLLGHPGTVIYSLTRLQFESNRISQYFIMVPFLFFYPNTTFYGADGWWRGLITNHIVWEAGLIFCVYRLVTPYLNPANAKRIWPEILVAASGLVQVIFYVDLVPLKHTQYLIPIGVFVAYFAADLLLSVYHALGRWKWGKIVFAGFYVFGAIFLFQVFVHGNSAKLYWTNTKELADVQEMFKKAPAKEKVLDLDGRMLYNPDAYYACCIPFGQFAGFLSHPLPDLPTVLAQNDVKYINQGELQRVNTLPGEWQNFIYSHYHSDSGNNAFLVRNDVK